MSNWCCGSDNRFLCPKGGEHSYIQNVLSETSPYTKRSPSQKVIRQETSPEEMTPRQNVPCWPFVTGTFPDRGHSAMRKNCLEDVGEGTFLSGTLENWFQDKNNFQEEFCKCGYLKIARAISINQSILPMLDRSRRCTVGTGTGKYV